MRWLRLVGLALGTIFTLLFLFIVFAFLYSGGWRYALLPHPERPFVKIAFPPIADWNTLDIKLRRSACLGRCPAYTVSIKGDGTVTYNGDLYVATTGKHQAHIPIEAVRALVRKFQDADFFWALDWFGMAAFDAPITRVSISFDGYHKEIMLFALHSDTRESAIFALPKAIDDAAGTQRWIAPDADGGTVRRVK